MSWERGRYYTRSRRVKRPHCSGVRGVWANRPPCRRWERICGDFYR
jgi:hypothetical protein